MNGAESLVHTLLRSGVDTCFCNPGTSEMHFVAALDRVPGMRCVLGLFEGVVTGAADGYARMSGKPAATLLHCGPGSPTASPTCTTRAAPRAPSSTWSATRPPTIGRTTPPDRRHRGLGARRLRLGAHRHLLGNRWRRCGGRGAGRRTHPGQIATLILPSDTSWDDGGIVADALPVPPRARLRPRPDPQRGGDPAPRCLPP